MTSVFRWFRSAPILSVGCVNHLKIGTIIKVPEVSKASVFLQCMPRIVCSDGFSEPPSWKFWSGCILLRCSSCSLPTAASSCAPTQERVPAASCPATTHRAKLHSRGPSTSPCSAPRSFGYGGISSCSTKERTRCLDPATPACSGRGMIAEAFFRQL